MSFPSGSLFQPAQSATSTTGGLFGGTGQTGTTTFGGFGAQQANTANQPFSFGTQQVNATPALGFGTQQTITTAAAPTFGFGTTQATSATPAFGFGAQTSTTPSFGFGGTQTSTAAPTFGFGGTQTNTGAPTFGFGQPQTSNTGFGFGLGTPAASTSAGLFSGTGGGSFGTSLGSTGTAPSGTSFSLGTPAFGSTAPSTGLFGQQAQSQPAPPAQQAGTQVESVLSSVLYCNVYGDERDAILARWNLLQAAWGTGKGFYSGTASAVQYTAENSLCRFKAIGYSKLPQGKNEDGIIVMLFNKPETELRRDQAQLVSVITTALGNKPNLNVTVEGVSGLDINKTEVLICVQERSATGAIHKVPAIELSSFLWNQQPPVMMQTARGQLSTLGVVSCVPRVRPTPEQLREYLASPPAGIDARIWKQAQSENPDRDNFIPIPLIGFGDLVRHLHLQEKETRRHQGTLDKLAEELANLQSRASETSVALSEQRRRYIDLQHRILKVLIKQECSRKEGFALQPEEERLRVQLESVHNELSIPTQFRGRLNELLSQIRMRQSAFMPAERMAERYNIEPKLAPNNNRPANAVAAAVPASPCHPTISQHHQPMVRLVTLPGLGTVQLQQIQTPNGPAFLAVQQPQQHQPQQQTQQQPTTFLRNHPGQPTFIQQHHVIQQQQQQPHIVTQQQQQQPHILTQQTIQQQQSQQQQDNIRLISSPATTLITNNDTVDNNTNNTSTTFATPPNKKPPAKKKPKPKKKKEEVVVEEKKPAVQVNLAELLKQTGIVDDDESFFMDDEPAPPPPPAPQQQPLVQIPEEQPILPAETKENNMMFAPMLSEMNLIQTLHQHGLALSDDDLHTLRNFIKPSEQQASEQSSALGGSDSLANGLKGATMLKAPAAAVSLTLGNGQVIQLTGEPFAAEAQQQPRVQFVTNAFDPQATQVFQAAPPPPAAPPPTTEVMHSTNHGFQNEFLEDLARSQIVSDSKKMKSKAALVQKTTPANANNNAPKKKAEPRKKKPPPVKAANSTAGTNSTATGTQSAGSNVANPTTPTNAGTVPRVQTIKLSPQNQQRFVNNSFPQNLRNIQAQIQYLTSKKDPTPQDTSLLQKLIEHHQKILATGKPVPTIPGQHAQGIPFNPTPAPPAPESESVVQPVPPTNTTTNVSRSQGKVANVPANIQQNTHLANLLRQPVSDKNSRMTTSNATSQQAGLRQIQPSATQIRTSCPAATQTTAGSPIASVTLTSLPNKVTISTPASISSVTSTASSNNSTTTSNASILSVTTTQSTIQSPMGTLIVTTMDRGASPVVSTVNNTSGSSCTLTNSPAVVSPAPSNEAGRSSNPPARGVKRPAPPAAPPKPSISKSTLFEHQLKTDQSGAIAPDCKTPFKNKSNACKRLVRYHVFHELGPTPKELEKEEEDLESHAQQLLSKFHQMINKYHYLLLMESTKEAPTSEHVMVERMFASEEKQSLERLKEETRVAKELQLTPVWPVKSEPTTSATPPVATNAADIVNGRRDSPSEDLKLTPKMALLKFTRKEGEGYKSELQLPQEYKDVRVMVEDVVRNNGRIRESLEMNHSVTVNDSSGLSGSAMESKPYDEWEAIQRELALYPDARDRDDLGFVGIDGEEGGVIYDEDIKAQMQNAIDDLLRLNGCDEVIPPHHHHIANAVHPTVVAPVAVGGASSSTHHYEPVTGSGGVAAGGLPSLKNGSEPLQPALEFPSNKGGR